MRIGQLAREVGVSADTVRFYERAGWLPRPARRDNTYREYNAADIEHLRLLIDLRRLGLSLGEAARIAGWCHSGHCIDTTVELPALIVARRAAISDQISRLQELDLRLARLGRHIGATPALPMLGQPAACCAAAGAVFAAADGECACCAAAPVEQVPPES